MEASVSVQNKNNSRVDTAAIGSFYRAQGRANAASSVKNQDTQSYTDYISIENAQSPAETSAPKKGFLSKLADGAWSVITTAWTALTGLFAKANETQIQVNEAVAKGDEAGAGQIKKDFLQKELKVAGVERMSKEKIDQLYEQAIGIMNEVGANPSADPQADIAKIRDAVNLLAILPIRDEQRVNAIDTAKKNVLIVVESADADQLVACSEELAGVGQAMLNLANSISDETLKASVLADLGQFTSDIASLVADKLLPAQNATQEDYLRTADFLDSVSSLPFNLIENDMTQKVLDGIQENNQKNIQADNVAYQKSLLENKFQKISMLRKALARKDEIKLVINKATQKMFMAILSQDADQIGKVKSEITFQEQKNPKIS